MRSTSLCLIFASLATLLLVGCSSTRHVPDGKYLLSKATVTVEGETQGLDATTLHNYLRQQPNQRVLGFAKLSLGVYNMSGNDTTKWWNRWLRNLGQAPVIHDSNMREQ